MDFRQRLDQSRSKNYSDEVPAEQELGDEGPYFATDRVRTPVCLELRLREGKRIALPYAYFTEFLLDADKGIELYTAQKLIHITGRNLAKLFDYLVTCRVRYIQANIGGDAQEDGLFIKDIIVDDLN